MLKKLGQLNLLRLQFTILKNALTNTKTKVHTVQIKLVLMKFLKNKKLIQHFYSFITSIGKQNSHRLFCLMHEYEFTL
jgi:hypothetical protein